MLKVGGEVDALCTRCELVLAHTIHAMMAGKPVKVECNTCHTVHRYRPGPGASGGSGGSGTRSTARRSAGQSAAGRARPEVAGFDELLAARDQSRARPYSPRERFAVDDVVDHSVFGRGFVSAVRDGDKIEITFRGDVKVLVHGRG